MLATAARHRAATEAPTAGELADLAIRATEARGPEQREALRHLTGRALATWQEVGALLGELKALIDDERDADDPRQ